MKLLEHNVKEHNVKTQKEAQIEGLRCRQVTFRLEAGPKCDVCLAGSFNNWNTSAYRLTPRNGNGTYVATIELPVGRHEYKFIVDGVWCIDPECAEWARNEHGSLNSVIEVR